MLRQLTAAALTVALLVPGEVAVEGLARRSAVYLRSMCQIQSNVHGVSVMVTENGETAERTIASAIYCGGSMFNHSCDPSAIARFHNNQLSVVTLRAVPSGGEVTISYGPLKGRTPRVDRQAVLGDIFHFACGCAACTSGVDDSFLHAYACARPSCEGGVVEVGEGCRCLKCGAARSPHDIQEAEALLEHDIERLHQSQAPASHRTSPAKQLCMRAASLYHRASIRLGQTYDRMARLCEEWQAYEAACEFCAASTKIVEQQFGADSLEVAREWSKLAHLQFLHNRGGLKLCQRALTLLRPVVGDEDADVEALRRLEAMLTA